MNIRVHRKAFLTIQLVACPRGLSLSRIYILWLKVWPLSCVCTSPLAVTTIARAARLRQSFQFKRIQFKSFSLIMCIDAQESTTIFSDLRFHGAGKHQFSESEKNAALFCLLILGIPSLSPFLLNFGIKFPWSIVISVGDRFSFMPITLFQ